MRLLVLLWGVAIPVLGIALLYFLIWGVAALFSRDVDQEMPVLFAVITAPAWIYAGYVFVRKNW